MSPPPLLSDRFSRLAGWLRRQLLTEALAEFFQGILFSLLGLMLMAVVFQAALFVVMSFALVSLSGSGPLAASTQKELQYVIFGFSGIFFIVQVFVLWRGYLFRWWIEELAGSEATTEKFFFQIFFAGATLGVTGVESFVKAYRLRRLVHRDLSRVVEIFVWLFERGKKATVEEIGDSLLGENAVRILPQLRDIPGVIWLTYRHGVIILSQDLRFKIARLLREGRMEYKPEPQFEPSPEPEDEPQPEPEPATEEPGDSTDDYSHSSEAVGWYKTLNLPPFAPLSVVKKRYRQLVKLHHPDAVASRSGRRNSDEQIKLINEAYHNIVEYSKAHR